MKCPILELGLEHVVPGSWDGLSRGSDPDTNVGLVGGRVTGDDAQLVGGVRLQTSIVGHTPNPVPQTHSWRMGNGISVKNDYR